MTALVPTAVSWGIADATAFWNDLTPLIPASLIVVGGLVLASAALFGITRHREPLVCAFAWLCNLIYLLLEITLRQSATAAVIGHQSALVGSSLFLLLAIRLLVRFSDKPVSWRASLIATGLAHACVSTLDIYFRNAPLAPVFGFHVRISLLIDSTYSATCLVIAAFAHFRLQDSQILDLVTDKRVIETVEIQRHESPNSGAVVMITPTTIVPTLSAVEVVSANRTIKLTLRTGKWFLVLSLVAYGALQLVYPFASWFEQNALSAVPYYCGLAAKLSLLTGLAILLLSGWLTAITTSQTNRTLADIGAVTASVQHDARAPIGVISTIASSLASNSKLQEDVKAIRRQLAIIQAALEVVPTLRELRELEHSTRAMQPVNLVTLVQQAIKQSASHFDIERRWMSLDCPYSSIKMNAFGERIVTGVSNLLNNAIEASTPKGARGPSTTIAVKVAVAGNGKTAEITITDTGGGISREMIERLGRPMESSKDTGNVNRGIGVFITTRIIQGHGGTISFETDNLTYTTAHVWLPIRSAERKAVQ